MAVSVGTFQADLNLCYKNLLPLLARSLFVTFATECGVI